MRLGIGQVHDYAHAIRTDPPVGISTARPVLVLERELDDLRWSDLCGSLGILLTWDPDFPESNQRRREGLPFRRYECGYSDGPSQFDQATAFILPLSETASADLRYDRGPWNW